MDRSRIRPSYPTLASSSTSSAFTSSNSLTSLPSPSAMSNQDQGEPHSAPLPSPTAEHRSFFGSLNPTSPLTGTSQQIPPQQQTHNQRQTSYQAQSMPQSPMVQHHPQGPFQPPQQQHQQAVPQHMQTGWNYAPDRKGAGTTNPETASLLRDYNLLAEAAKRAQVACMIRDLDAMDMS